MFVKQINYHPEEATESFKTAQGDSVEPGSITQCQTQIPGQNK